MESTSPVQPFDPWPCGAECGQPNGYGENIEDVLDRLKTRSHQRTMSARCYSTFVAIHQVVPPASRTPPRLSSSCFFTGSTPFTSKSRASFALQHIDIGTCMGAVRDSRAEPSLTVTRAATRIGQVNANIRRRPTTSECYLRNAPSGFMNVRVRCHRPDQSPSRFLRRHIREAGRNNEAFCRASIATSSHHDSDQRRRRATQIQAPLTKLHGRVSPG